METEMVPETPKHMDSNPCRECKLTFYDKMHQENNLFA